MKAWLWSGRLASVLVMVSGCSQRLDWREDFLACAGSQCAEGFSCAPRVLGEQSACVRHATLELGHACTLDAQCDGGARCAGGACRVPCSGVLSTAACDNAGLCQTMPDASGPACMPSAACAAGATCWDAQRGAGVCVAFSDSVRRCLPPCGVDTQGHVICGAEETCRAVGAAHSREWVCVDNATAMSASH